MDGLFSASAYHVLVGGQRTEEPPKRLLWTLE
jgi:hypothetical protein